VTSIPALKVIKVLFEGQTRKIGANNFLRHIYTGKFSKIFIPQLQEVIIRQILNNIHAKRQKYLLENPDDQALNPRGRTEINSRQIPKETSNEKTKKPGFFRKVAKSIAGVFTKEEKKTA